MACSRDRAGWPVMRVARRCLSLPRIQRARLKVRQRDSRVEERGRKTGYRLAECLDGLPVRLLMGGENHSATGEGKR